jgi:5-methylcytosine-specific restriction endonuclease McrA
MHMPASPAAKKARKRMKRCLRERIKQQNGQCIWCGRRMAPLGDRHKHPLHKLAPTIEHVLPKRQGGSNAQINLVAACYGCNTKRGGAPAATTPHMTALSGLPSDVQLHIARVDIELEMT